MSRLDELPPDQRAALTILLSRHKSYAEVGKLLGISDRAVHDRAHAALAMLAPRQARELSAEQRAEIGDYLLGQQPRAAEGMRTRTYLGSSEPARAWALALTGELAPLVDGALPEIPVPAPAPVAGETAGPAAGAGAPEAPPPAATRPRGAGGLPRSSRTGGAILLVLLLAGVIVAVALVGGGSSHHGTTGANTAKTAAAGSPAVTARIPLRSPSAHSRSVGLVDVLQEGSKRAFYIAAEHLPPTHGFFYAIWLYNSPTSHQALSRAPAVGANRRLEGGALLPSSAGDYHTILLTRETSSRPRHPGRVVLRGAFTLGS